MTTRPPPDTHLQSPVPAPPETLEALLARIRACRVCVEAPIGRPLPHEPHPVLHVGARARLLIAGQAPGTKVHASGQSFDDASGERLRAWLGIDRARFYDEEKVAIAAMGFCFPGQDAKGGDLPPRRECARLWHDRLFASRPPFGLVVAVGSASQAYHLRRLGLGAYAGLTLTERVTRWQEIFGAERDEAEGERLMPLPHPSWRNTGWLKRHPWFEAELLPVLRAEVARLIG
ncbi:uracil-DNA glycosylase family protein [Ancylobacter pratisalsi]|uniref:Uracil-DNA glycosylase family protein n=1 Tax=Ancylobacter pratisalsi TaxID=1745854 RepID=A0A6P1YIE3_9HYPH|nr:uracil-DNA glycosylase family protein [Ancylobacter pratisalsi]QIB32875.1 uracil-DNA glycosylase family protein [Ancylobacter pratisalsi]